MNEWLKFSNECVLLSTNKWMKKRMNKWKCESKAVDLILLDDHRYQGKMTLIFSKSILFCESRWLYVFQSQCKHVHTDKKVPKWIKVQNICFLLKLISWSPISCLCDNSYEVNLLSMDLTYLKDLCMREPFHCF